MNDTLLTSVSGMTANEAAAALARAAAPWHENPGDWPKYLYPGSWAVYLVPDRGLGLVDNGERPTVQTSGRVAAIVMDEENKREFLAGLAGRRVGPRWRGEADEVPYTRIKGRVLYLYSKQSLQDFGAARLGSAWAWGGEMPDVSRRTRGRGFDLGSYRHAALNGEDLDSYEHAALNGE